jgi:hypothetical protein
MPPRKFIVKKANSSDDLSSFSEQTSEESYTYETITTQEGGKKWKTFSESGYKRPKETKQDQLTKEEILKKLKGYIRVKYSDQLSSMTPFKTWVKYINKSSKKFRQGGLYVKSGFTSGSPDGVPTYIVLYNPKINIVWSVQLKNNWLYIPLPNTSVDGLNREEQKKEEAIKTKLYELYLDNRLKITDRGTSERSRAQTQSSNKITNLKPRSRYYTEIILDRSEK